jgi:pyruvate,water dikinase
MSLSPGGCTEELTVTVDRDDFAVDWGDPEDAGLTWTFDAMHNPDPVLPLAQHFMRTNNRVVFGGRTRYVNGYGYALMTGIPAPTTELFSRGLSVWDEDYVPRLDAFCRGVVARDWETMGTAELADELDRLAEDAAEHFKLTMVVILPFMFPTYEVIGIAEAALGDDGPRLVGQLLQGHENASASAGLRLGALAERASGWPEVGALLRDGNHATIERAAGGPEFLAELRAFLDEFGWRLETWSSMHVATWAEDWMVPLGLVARYLEDGAARPADAIARSRRDREMARAEMEARLDTETREQITSRLARIEGHVSISESRAHWQLTIYGVLRRPILAYGRKLAAAGAIDAPEDVFFLYWDEALAGSDGGTSFGVLVADRREEFERWRTLTPPPFIGAPPVQDAGPGAMVGRHFFGIGVQPSTDERVVTGIGASRGTFTGRARVIGSLAQSDRLEAGDVLVCATTAAPWTPLFAVAGAVVTDSGGVLSHSAICAREYAIPAVVGTQVGTARIPDGAVVTVDGERGVVRIEG